MLRIYCKNTGTCKEFQEGTTLLEMVDEFEFDKPYDIISAKVNNVSEGLKFRVFNNRDVEFLDYRSYSGRNVYCRSLCFLLYKAARDIFPECKLVIRRPISKGYYCMIDKGNGIAVDAADVEALRAASEAFDQAFEQRTTEMTEHLPERANKVLGWTAKETLADTLASAWKWQLRLREKGIM